jgi:zinc transport system substrate-binding protein
MLIVALAAACLSCSAESTAPPVIAASIPPVASLVREVAGDRLPVVSLMPPGRSPHDYEPTPAELRRLRNAVLFVHVGQEIDSWMLRAAAGVVGESASIVTMNEGSYAPDQDPHLWLDMDAVTAFLPRLAGHLGGLDPEGAREYRMRAEALLDSLRSLDRETRELLSPVAQVPFALQHPAMAPFVRRYELNLVGILQIHPEGEARPMTLGDVTRSLQASGARVIFAEPQLQTRLAEMLAHDLEAAVAFLDPLGGPGVEGRETYLRLLRWNVRQLAENLGETGE